METEKNWYVIHTYSGYENKVKTNLERKVLSMDMENEIFQVIVPMEDEIIFKDGKKKIIKKKIFPGYVLIEMIVTDKSWYIVRNIPGVTSFVGSGSKPIPLSISEVKSILKSMGVEETKQRINICVNEFVKIKYGAFENWSAKVIEVLTDKGKIKVLVSMFGRETPIELDFSQVEKL